MSHVSAPKTRNPSKLVVGIVVAAMTAFVGLAGVASATSDKPSKEWCMQHGFKNYGQCVKVWARSHHHGGGYGGGYGNNGNGNGHGHHHGHGNHNNHGNNNSNGHGNKGGNVTVRGNVTTNVGVSVNGNNNVITVIINYFFGTA